MLKSRANSADFQDLNQRAPDRTRQQERDRLNRIVDSEAANTYERTEEVEAVGDRMVNTKVINAKLYNNRSGNGAVTNNRLYNDRNAEGTVINGKVYNVRGDGGGGGSNQRSKGTVINGSAEERIVHKVINGVVGNAMVKRPR